MVEHRQNQVSFSPEIQQALNKLNVRLADLMEQMNLVINVLFEENVVLRAKFEELSSQHLIVKEVK